MIKGVFKHYTKAWRFFFSFSEHSGHPRRTRAVVAVWLDAALSGQFVQTGYAESEVNLCGIFPQQLVGYMLLSI